MLALFLSAFDGKGVKHLVLQSGGNLFQYVPKAFLARHAVVFQCRIQHVHYAESAVWAYLHFHECIRLFRMKAHGVGRIWRYGVPNLLGIYVRHGEPCGQGGKAKQSCHAMNVCYVRLLFNHIDCKFSI